MGRLLKSWVDQARLKLWRTVVRNLTGDMSYHQMDRHFGLMRKSADRQRVFERVFERDHTPPDQLIFQVSEKEGFAVTAPVYFSDLWSLLRHPPDSVREADLALDRLMNETTLHFLNRDEWHLLRDQLCLEYRTNEAEAYRMVVHHSAHSAFLSNMQRLAFLLACFYRVQLRRETEILEELTRAIDEALDLFFHASFGMPDGQNYYYEAIDQVINRSLPAKAVAGGNSPLGSPPLSESMVAWGASQMAASADPEV
jgi:hypothetical protein